jgi:IclR family transcriptional regulator, pca regulon regulatory protein
MSGSRSAAKKTKGFDRSTKRALSDPPRDASLVERDFVGAFEKGLAVIEAFDSVDSALTPTDIANKTGLTRAGARRYLLTLAKLHYADFDGKFFRLTPRVMRLGHAYLDATPLPRLVRPILEKITERTRESASLTVLDGTDAVFIARSNSPRIASVSIGVGTRLPAYCTASGRVLMSTHTDAEISRYLQTVQPTRYTQNTLIGQDELLKAFRDARTVGYSINDEEFETGLRSIAVPVINSRRDVIAALTVSVPAGRMSREKMIEEILPALEAGNRMLTSML